MKNIPLKVFIDTEFTSLINPKLISIGLVAETGEEAYFEIPFDRTICSEFVRDVVIPLLLQDQITLISSDLLKDKIVQWLKLVKATEQKVEICFDHEYDWMLFFEVVGDVSWINPRNIDYELSLLLLEDFYATNKLAEHFALNDARANAFAFRERKTIG
ncbi:hypothetical protein [Massilia timonae]|uniref:hypothetical protein n=1 Tax=Massilia timonae TaxID=47229 RepID=UPI00059402F9|nr:hypothetical protein [Massilia timonae]